ncbi:MAG: CRISPR-associated RAMP protein Csx7 [Elainella sp. Prado103]|jgi:CRISPR-associated RAMP protein (TIGR02581 family)|nr:CRISPR-associated RAMP protein Csx7 [Elainella sp. Prado103]
MFDTFKNRLELTGTLTTITALKIGAGRSIEVTDPDVPVVKDANGHPLIPGSSFKGALRSRLESFLRGIDPEFAHDPSELTSSRWMNRVKNLKKTADNISDAQDRDIHLTRELVKLTDKVSLMFGSPWLAGKLQIRDLTVQEGNWFGQYQERDGVAIDRDTETAADQRKYDFQVVPAGTIFDFKAAAENLKEPELGLLMVGLTQFENEMIPLGGGRSRGLGVVRLDLTEMVWVNPQNRDELLQYMQDLITGTMQQYIFTQQEVEIHKANWALKLVEDLMTPTASV